MCRVVPLVALVVVASSIGGGCAVRQLARTVGAGRSEFGLLVGGPLQGHAGFPAPVPEHRVRARYGLIDDLDIDGTIVLGPIASATLAFDVGFVAQIVRTAPFALAASARLHCMYDLDDGFQGAYYPEFGLHLEHRIDRRVALLGGTQTMMQFAPPAERPAVFLAPYAGVEVLLGEHALSLAAAWINPWDDSRSVVRWEPAGLGAIVVTFGWRIQPGGIR